MAEDQENGSVKGERKILSPGTWFFYSFILWSIVIVPLMIGAFYILEVFPRFTDLGNEYSAMVGLFLGILAAAIVGYIYSNRARKHAE
jgi:hypothetical protein